MPTIRLPFDSAGQSIAVTQNPGEGTHGSPYPPELYTAWDFALPVGSDVVAVAPGVVEDIRSTVPDGAAGTVLPNMDGDGLASNDDPSLGSGGIGNIVTIRHDLEAGTFYSSYFHLAEGSIPFEPADIVAGTARVEAGDVIGRTGLTGSREGVTGAHLHFQVGSEAGFFGATNYGGGTGDNARPQFIATADSSNAGLVSFEDHGATLPDNVVGPPSNKGDDPVGQASARGAEFLVHDPSDDWQRDPVVSGILGGGFVAVWRTSDPSWNAISSDAIKARVFDVDGTALGAEFLVNDQSQGFQYQPTISALPDGGFVAAWSTNDSSQDGSGDAIKARVFDAVGEARGPEFLVNNQGEGAQRDPTISALPDGGFVAAWRTDDPSQDGSNAAIKARVFDSDGDARGPEFLVNDQAESGQSDPKISALPDGGFVAAWVTFDSSQDGSRSAIKARVFDADGEPRGPEFLVNDQSEDYQWFHTISALPDGGFVAAWSTNDSSQDGSGDAIKARVFDAVGEARGLEFLVNDQVEASQEGPTISALPDGGFVAAWYTNGDTPGDGASTAIKARVFDADGDALGLEFLVNSRRDFREYNPTISALSDGGFVAAWTRESIFDCEASEFECSGFDIGARVFDVSAFSGNRPVVTAPDLAPTFDLAPLLETSSGVPLDTLVSISDPDGLEDIVSIEIADDTPGTDSGVFGQWSTRPGPDFSTMIEFVPLERPETGPYRLQLDSPGDLEDWVYRPAQAGTNAIQVEATDAAGNVSEPLVVTLTFDAGAVVEPILGPQLRLGDLVYTVIDTLDPAAFRAVDQNGAEVADPVTLGRLFHTLSALNLAERLLDRGGLIEAGDYTESQIDAIATLYAVDHATGALTQSVSALLTGFYFPAAAKTVTVGLVTDLVKGGVESLVDIALAVAYPALLNGNGMQAVQAGADRLDTLRADLDAGRVIDVDAAAKAVNALLAAHILFLEAGRVMSEDPLLNANTLDDAMGFVEDLISPVVNAVINHVGGTVVNDLKDLNNARELLEFTQANVGRATGAVELITDALGTLSLVAAADFFAPARVNESIDAIEESRGGTKAPRLDHVTQLEVPETALTVVDLDAVDDEDVEGESLVYRIDGGADGDLFSVNAFGRVRFDSARDFEAPTDADADGTYEAVVRVTDSDGRSTVTNLFVNVLNDPSDDRRASTEVLEYLARQTAYGNGAIPFVEGGEATGVDLLEGWSVSDIWDGITFHAIALEKDGYRPVLAIRGTVFDDPFDWLMNTPDAGVGSVEARRNWDGASDIRGWLSDNPLASITGHSQGGSIAMDFAQRATANGLPVGDLVTFNAAGITLDGDGMTNADRVVHYVSSGDIASLAGEGFVDGQVILYDLDSDIDELSQVAFLADVHTGHWAQGNLYDLVDTFDDRAVRVGDTPTLTTDILNLPTFSYFNLWPNIDDEGARFNDRLMAPLDTLLGDRGSVEALRSNAVVQSLATLAASTWKAQQIVDSIDVAIQDSAVNASVSVRDWAVERVTGPAPIVIRDGLHAGSTPAIISNTATGPGEVLSSTAAGNLYIVTDPQTTIRQAGGDNVVWGVAADIDGLRFEIPSIHDSVEPIFRSSEPSAAPVAFQNAFTLTDAIFVQGAAFDSKDIIRESGSAILRINFDQDGVPDATVTMEGTYDLASFVTEAAEDGTYIRYLGDSRTIFLEDGERFRFEDREFDRAIATEGGGRVRIFGDERGQEMVGNSSSNVLVSGGGEDVMTGGAGADYFAFQRTNPPADAVITDFDTQDKLLLDDRFFGMGGGGTDLRALAPADVRGLLNDGMASFSLRNKQLSVDIDGPDGPGGLEVIATFEGPLKLGIDDVMLF